MMPASKSVADRIRAIATTPTPEALAELSRIAVEVARMAAVLDEIVDDERERVSGATASAGAMARMWRAARHRGRLVLVGGGEDD